MNDDDVTIEATDTEKVEIDADTCEAFHMCFRFLLAPTVPRAVALEALRDVLVSPDSVAYIRAKILEQCDELIVQARAEHSATAFIIPAPGRSRPN